MFLGSISLYSEKNYIKNPIKEFGIEDIEVSHYTAIPLKVSYFIDEEAKFNCDDLEEVKFASIPSSFNPGFYKGVLWLDISYLDKNLHQGNDFYLYFGNEPLDLAEAYIEYGDGWTLLGRTGRSIRRKQMSDPSWELIISVNEAELPKSTYQHLRVKVVSSFGVPVHVSLYSKDEFQKSGMFFSTANFVTFGFSFLIIIFLFACGIIFKDNIYRLLAFASLFMFFLILQLKGLGPMYLWNFIVTFDNSSRLTYFLGAGSFILSVFVMTEIVREENKTIRGRSLIYSMIVLCALSCISSIFIPSPYVLFLTYSILLVLNTVLFIISIQINRKAPVTESLVILLFFFPVMLIVGGMQAVFLIRLFTKSVAKMKIRGYDFYLYDLCFMFMTVPAVYLTFKRFGKKYKRMEKTLITAMEKELEYKKDKSLFHAMTCQLLTLSDLIHNSIELPQMKTENDSVKEIHGMIERSSVQLIDYLNAFLVFGTKSIPESSPILLSFFFESCAEIIRSPAIRKNIKISLSNSVDEKHLVRANRNILELIFTHFMLTIVRYSKSNSNIVLSLSQKENEVSLKTKIHVDSEAEKYMDEVLGQNYFLKQSEESPSDEIGFRLVVKALEIYGGTFTHSKENKSYKISLKMKLPPVDETFNHELISVQTLFDTESQKELNNSNKTIPVVDNLFSDFGKTIIILLVEESIVAKRFWEDILNGRCIIKTTASGVEAWNYLHTADNPKPDIIFCNYSLPVMNGRELFRKCSDDENTRDIPFVFILSPIESDRKYELMRRGAVDCIVRPYSRREVYGVICMVLSISKKIQHSILSQLDRVVRGQMNSSPRQEYMQVQTQAMGNISLTKSQTSIFLDSGLSSREQQIAILISHGKSDKEIADALHITPSTVASHNKKIFRKLNVHSRVELMDKVR